MSTGWTWDYVEQEVDLPRLTALSGYWRRHPPMHIMVAAYLGVGDKPARERDEDGTSLFDLFPGSPGGG